jgi:hypothetical protein
MTDTQLELSLEGVRVTQSRRRNRQPSNFTSRWWFQRMRQIVDCAFDWQPAQEPRPEQIWLPGTHRQVGVNS